MGADMLCVDHQVLQGVQAAAAVQDAGMQAQLHLQGLKQLRLDILQHAVVAECD